MTEIDKILRAARKAQPELWKRTEQVARIIAPEAFSDGWIVEPEESARLFRARLRMQQSIAMSKAQDVLKFLGVNTEADWVAILNQLAADAPAPTART